MFSKGLLMETIQIDIEKGIKIDDITLKKMTFFYNALESGWSIKKIKGDKYMFTKNHEGKKEVFLNSYITNFLKSNIDMNKLMSRDIEP